MKRLSNVQKALRPPALRKLPYGSSINISRVLDCITMSAPLDAIRVLLIGFGRKEPEFGSYAGQLDTGHGAP